MSMFRLEYLRQYRWEDMRQISEHDRAEMKRTDASLSGRLCVISGATSGVGHEAARELAAAGASLVLINRDRAKSELLCRELQEEFGIACSFLIADFADLGQVRAAAEILMRDHPRIDILVNNAGMHSTTLQRTADGEELVFCVNHLASFLLTWMLLETMRRSAPSRIIQVNSQGHRFDGLDPEDLSWKRRRYTGLRGYGASKTAQLLCMWEFADIVRGSGVTINAVHPGAVKTGIGSNNGPLYRWFKTAFLSRSLHDPSISGQAIRYLAAAPELAQTSGQYFNLTCPEKPAPHALDRAVGRQIWEESMKRTGLSP
jgi:NAD(P)-dependent dehydrogenase (short-subunit alcohol dehydrogenase family)